MGENTWIPAIADDSRVLQLQRLDIEASIRALEDLMEKLGMKSSYRRSLLPEEFLASLPEIWEEMQLRVSHDLAFIHRGKVYLGEDVRKNDWSLQAIMLCLANLLFISKKPYVWYDLDDADGGRLAITQEGTVIFFPEGQGYSLVTGAGDVTAYALIDPDSEPLQLAGPACRLMGLGRRELSLLARIVESDLLEED